MNTKIWLSSPHMGGEEQKYVNDAFENNWIAPLGPNVDNFELDITSYLNVNAAAALSSGTAALHLALIMLGVKANDEVICQSMTFSASANPIAYLGANPIFVDSERDTWNICPELLRKTIKDRIKKGKKPKAIIPVHLYGMPAQMNEIMDIANEYEIAVIEDAAEALGSEISGRKMGTYGEMSILSFNGNKIITTSGGGALVSNNDKYVENARFLSTQARDPAPHYQHSEIGYNYRMSNICAGIGRGQMKVIKERVAQRRIVFDFYKKSLSDIKGIKFLIEPADFKSNRWLTTILIDSDSGFTNEDLRLALEKENIESRPLWKPMHIQPVFQNSVSYTNGVSEDLFKRGLCLPSGSNLSVTDLERVTTTIKKYANK